MKSVNISQQKLVQQTWTFVVVLNIFFVINKCSRLNNRIISKVLIDRLGTLYYLSHLKLGFIGLKTQLVVLSLDLKRIKWVWKGGTSQTQPLKQTHARHLLKRSILKIRVMKDLSTSVLQK